MRDGPGRAGKAIITLMMIVMLAKRKEKAGCSCCSETTQAVPCEQRAHTQARCEHSARQAVPPCDLSSARSGRRTLAGGREKADEILLCRYLMKNARFLFFFLPQRGTDVRVCSLVVQHVLSTQEAEVRGERRCLIIKVIITTIVTCIERWVREQATGLCQRQQLQRRWVRKRRVDGC